MLILVIIVILNIIVILLFIIILCSCVGEAARVTGWSPGSTWNPGSVCRFEFWQSRCPDRGPGILIQVWAEV